MDSPGPSEIIDSLRATRRTVESTVTSPDGAEVRDQVVNVIESLIEQIEAPESPPPPEKP
jgi:hypothetical protein